MSKVITELQAIELLQTMMDEIPIFKVYYTMREMKLKRLHTSTVKYMRACLAIHLSGLPITTDLLSAIIDVKRVSTIPMLHSLGDKNCLVLKRMHGKKNYEWVVHPVFLKHFYGEIDEHV